MPQQVIVNIADRHQRKIAKTFAAVSECIDTFAHQCVLVVTLGLVISHFPKANAQTAPSNSSPCAPLERNPSNEMPRSPPQIYAAARRFFVAHTGPRSRQPLRAGLVRHLRTLHFENTNWRALGTVAQRTIDDITTRFSGSLVFPTRQPPLLQPDACYDEVYLDLTEDGRYVVIVETNAARPVFMYWQQYRP